MPKIILTAEEEIQYLRELDRLQAIIPELEVHIVNEPISLQSRPVTESSIGEEFRNFLKANNFKLTLADTGVATRA